MADTNIIGGNEATISIVVSGGTGSATFSVATVKIDTIYFNGPAAQTFTYSIADRNNRGVTGKANVAVDTSLVVERVCIGQNTLTISGATLDGTYTATLRLLKSY